MRKYYIVTQADISDNGHFQYANGVFQDDVGNPELYINAEEARESLAKDVDEMCKEGNAFCPPCAPGALILGTRRHIVGVFNKRRYL